MAESGRVEGSSRPGLARRLRVPPSGGRPRTIAIVAAWSRLSVDERPGVLDSPLEDLVGELAVGEGAGQLQRPHHHGEEPDGSAASGLRIRGRQTGGDLFHDGRRALGVRLLGAVRAAADLVEQCGGGASGAGPVTVLGRQIAANEVLKSLSTGPQRVALIRQCAQFMGDDVGDELVLGGEVGVERSIGEPEVALVLGG